MDRLKAMQLFARIVELGSFTQAAIQLDMSRASATALIRQLESHLGTSLLQRTTRQVSPTQEGESYYRDCLSILADVAEAESALIQRVQHPRGRLRVDLPASLGRLVVIPALPDFHRRYPDVVLEISVSDRNIDLLREGVDCVLRIGALRDSTLIARHLADLEQVTCVSQEYIACHGEPQTLEALEQHFCVEFVSATTGRVDPLRFLQDGKLVNYQPPSLMAVNNGISYVAACEAGMGIAQVPHYHVAHSLARGALKEVLADFRPPPLPLTLLYPQHRQLPLRLRVFIDWLVMLFTRHGRSST